MVGRDTNVVMDDFCKQVASGFATVVEGTRTTGDENRRDVQPRIFIETLAMITGFIMR